MHSLNKSDKDIIAEIKINCKLLIIHWMRIKLLSLSLRKQNNSKCEVLAIQYVNKQNVNANSNTFQILVGILSYDDIYF